MCTQCFFSEKSTYLALTLCWTHILTQLTLTTALWRSYNCSPLQVRPQFASLSLYLWFSTSDTSQVRSKWELRSLTFILNIFWFLFLERQGCLLVMFHIILEVKVTTYSTLFHWVWGRRMPDHFLQKLTPLRNCVYLFLLEFVSLLELRIWMPYGESQARKWMMQANLGQ